MYYQNRQFHTSISNSFVNYYIFEEYSDLVLNKQNLKNLKKKKNSLLSIHLFILYYVHSFHLFISKSHYPKVVIPTAMYQSILLLFSLFVEFIFVSIVR